MPFSTSEQGPKGGGGGGLLEPGSPKSFAKELGALLSWNKTKVVKSLMQLLTEIFHLSFLLIIPLKKP